MIDDIDFIDDLDVSGEDIEAFDSEPSEVSCFMETTFQQEDNCLLDSSTTMLNANYENTSSIGMDSGNVYYDNALMNESTHGFLDFLHGHLSNEWFNEVQKYYGLSDIEIAQSVQEASDFFNMENPMIVQEGRTTGVLNRIPMTETDDILIFNKEQLQDMGITDKEGFDLVMTHEATHRALQGMKIGFTEHQEELFCDYMPGVRAGLNGMDEGKLASSLENTMGCESHPDGAIRVESIEAGVSFAHQYMQSHGGTAPSLDECLNDFMQTDVYKSTCIEQDGQVAFKGFVNDREYYLKKAANAKENVDYYTKEATRATERGDLSAAKDHARTAESYRSKVNDALRSADMCTK